jgi:quercetin dioxygenase-like cupin family protein
MPQHGPGQAWFDLDRIAAELSRRGGPWHEFLRRPAMRAGLYRLAAGAEDRQEPHAEDEIYLVLRGHARLWTGDETRAVAPGTLAFVAAGVPHRFVEITDELEVLVLFAAPPG